MDTGGTDLKPEHFRVQVEESTTLRITGGDGRGVLYGVQECIDRARRDQAIAPMTDGPLFALRSIDLWENISGQIWCLPFDSILDYDKMLHAEEVPEYEDLARRLLAMRVNSLLLSSQYAPRGSLFKRWLSHAEPIEQFARFMDRYGVAIRLALHYVSPDDEGNWTTLCPFNDAVREQWHDFVASMAIAMPTVRDVRVRGSGGEAPGPPKMIATAAPRRRHESGSWQGCGWSPTQWPPSAAMSGGPRIPTRQPMPKSKQSCLATGAMSFQRICGSHRTTCIGTTALRIHRTRSGITSARSVESVRRSSSRSR